jgi:hypothetical protein
MAFTNNKKIDKGDYMSEVESAGQSSKQVTKVKGSMLVGFVKAIKADTTGRFDDVLSDEAKTLIENRILAANWYPFEAYKNCFQAVCKVNAQSNPQIMYQFGQKAGEETMSSIYRTVFQKDSAEGVMESFAVIGNTVYDSVTVATEVIGDNEIKLTITDFDPDFEEWYQVGRGWIERTLELVLQKDVTSNIVDKSWDGAPATVIHMSW